MPAVTQGGASSLRPIPGSVIYSGNYLRAISRGTRSKSGSPTPSYWQNTARYDIRARFHPANGILDGSETINYVNRSPDTLQAIVVHLYQNLHKIDAVRMSPQEITGGVTLRKVVIDGEIVDLAQSEGGTNRLPALTIRGTVATIRPSAPVMPGDSVRLEVIWSATLPQENRFGRTGRNGNMYFVAYWFPRIAVYDDLRGWDAPQDTDAGEHYDESSDFDVILTLPTQWTALATGTLQNAAQVLRADVVGRMNLAASSDTVVHVVRVDDVLKKNVTRSSSNGTLDWRFSARGVPDFVWITSNEQVWDSRRAWVGEAAKRHSVIVNSLWRRSATSWARAADLVAFTLEHHSRLLGLDYPWPHMSAIEGGALQGDGGMEYPMITLMGDRREKDPEDLQEGLAHEIGHMWVPMVLQTNQTREPWIDEGIATFLDNRGQKAFYPATDPDSSSREVYLGAARSGDEVEVSRPADEVPRRSPAGGIAHYQKSATLLLALRGLLGPDTFRTAFQTFIRDWAFKHPTGYDFFETFSRVSGTNLDWFWQTWYFETWPLDQAINSVEITNELAKVTIDDRGLAPMPVDLSITRDSGIQETLRVPVDVWLGGAQSTCLTIPLRSGRITRIEIDAGRSYPDINRKNNVWTAPKGAGN